MSEETNTAVEEYREAKANGHTSNDLPKGGTGIYTGRTVLTTTSETITRDNLLIELQNIQSDFSTNQGQIQYLYNYYNGKQPITGRTKDVRPDICNNVVVNRASEIVDFKVGYLCGEPIQYVARNSSPDISLKISRLNEMMYSEDKASKDRGVIEWSMICGTAYRLVLPDSFYDRKMSDADDAPFEIDTLDPRDTFVVYSRNFKHEPKFAGTSYKDNLGNPIWEVYTDRAYFKVIAGKIVEERPHALGYVPIFEYPANPARTGAFEKVLPLLDAINTVVSNRVDGVEQFVQAFIKFVNCDIDSDEYDEFLSKGAIKVKSTDGSKADVDLVTKELNQEQTQTLVEDLYQTVLTICGIPDRNGTGASDTGLAVMLRDGWSLAEARAKASELMFKESERAMLRLALKLTNEMSGLGLKIKDIAMQFTRRNYENIQSKAQVLDLMLKNDKIHPLLAFTHCGMFSDPEDAYNISKDYYDENQLKAITNESEPNPLAS